MPSQFIVPAHSLSGSVPGVMNPHVPLVPLPFLAAVHAEHVPEQALSQQTPSAQTLLKQSAGLAGHVAPFSYWQAPAPSQDTSAPEQMPAGKLSSVPRSKLWHVPMKPMTLQAMHTSVHAVSQQTPSVQLLWRQSVPMAQVWPSSNLQLPAPSHDCVFPEHAIMPLVSSWFTGTFEHVPTLPATLHAWHVPVHAVLQQTPSTQWLFAQWFDVVHVAPLGESGTHALLEQKKPEAQSVSPAHEVLQAFVTQVYPALQAVVPLSTHTPMPLHVSALT